MSTLLRSAIVALAFATLSSTALAEPARRPAGPRTHAHARRVKTELPGGRSRASDDKPAKKAPPEKPESVGSPNEGRLEGGVHLDLKKPYFRVVPAYESGDVRWGLPALVNMIDRAARAVNKRYPGSVLDVGDLSREGGGDVLRHHSHESGRDADLGFYAVDARGKQVHGKTFIKFDKGPAASNAPGARFDLARNWLFVQEMLTDPQARVSHIFVAAPLRQELLAYARSRGVSRALLSRAAVVMMQPTTSLPHDDHFHVRISCPATMRQSCVELAKGALRAKAHVAHGRGSRTMVTPGVTPGSAKAEAKADAHAKSEKPAAHAKAEAHAKASARPEPRAKKPGAHDEHLPRVRPPAASAAASQDVFSLPGADIDDAGDVHDVVDESGTIRITD